jgi:hypothetical protein
VQDAFRICYMASVASWDCSDTQLRRATLSVASIASSESFAWAVFESDDEFWRSVLTDAPL